MTYFLDNGDVLSLSVDAGYVAFMIWCHVREAPILSSVRFKPINLFSPGHLTMLQKLMHSPNRGDRNIGLTVLQQTLNVNINGELLG